MTPMAEVNAATEVLVKPCSADRDAMPLPLLSVAAMPASTAARLSVVTPVTPIRASSLAVNAGVGV